MKIEWQEADVYPGRVIARPGRNERWMIGYVGAEETSARFVLVSLSDGMVTEQMTVEAMTASLNKNNEMPAEFVDSASPQAKGGRARAAALSPQQRSAQASDAANARWNTP